MKRPERVWGDLFFFLRSQLSRGFTFVVAVVVIIFFWESSVSAMPADTMEKQTASPIAGAPANGSHTPDKPKNASEHRKVRSHI